MQSIVECFTCSIEGTMARYCAVNSLLLNYQIAQKMPANLCIFIYIYFHLFKVDEAAEQVHSLTTVETMHISVRHSTSNEYK